MENIEQTYDDFTNILSNEELENLAKKYNVVDKRKRRLPVCIFFWLMVLSGCWQYPNRSLHKAAQTVRKHALHLAIVFASGCVKRLHEALEIIQRCLAVGCRLNKRKTKPNTYQLLLSIQ